MKKGKYDLCFRRKYTLQNDIEAWPNAYLIKALTSLSTFQLFASILQSPQLSQPLSCRPETVLWSDPVKPPQIFLCPNSSSRGAPLYNQSIHTRSHQFTRTNHCDSTSAERYWGHRCDGQATISKRALAAEDCKTAF